MITREMLCRSVGVDSSELEYWVERAWVVPEGRAGDYLFREIDVARARLILELRHDLGVDEEALPMVLSLLDQLYQTRRQMRALCDVVGQAMPDDLRSDLFARLREATENFS